MTVVDSLVARLVSHAALNPSQAALRSGGRELTYGELQARVAAFASGLRDRLQPRSAVVICSRDPLFISSAFLALGALNHNALILNPEWPDAMQASVWQRLRPALWLGDSVPVWAEGLTAGDMVESATTSASIMVLQELISARDTQALFYTGFTSGSSGLPKGFSRHEQSWLASFNADQQVFGFRRGEVFHCPGSLAHSLFLYAVMRALYAGGTADISEGFRASQTLTQIQREGGVLFAVPTQMLALTDAADRPVPELQKVLSSGAKLQTEALCRLRDTFPNASIFEFYGSSELSYISVADQQAPSNSVGKPLAGVEVSIRNERGEYLDSGDKGLIFVESDLVFAGYAGEGGTVHREGLTETQGALSCRDIGYRDAAGYLYITGRADRMMLVAGRNVYPEEIEAVLMSHPDVRQAAVLPRTDRLRGTRPVALLQADATLTRKALQAYCRERLPTWMVPAMYYCMDDWPLTVSGKTDFPALQAQLQEGGLPTL